MTDLHPITPPDELVRQWRHQWICCLQKHDPDLQFELQCYIAAQASQWAADAELEACCEWLRGYTSDHMAIYFLRDARRPKPPSKAESALNALEHILRHSQTDHGANTIRLALEHLKKLEEATND